MLISDISRGLNLPVDYLETLAATASYRYKRYPIPKKSGGVRLISHPARELKLVQNWLVDNVLNRLPVHDSATAYRQGSSILKNAAPHAKNNFLLRIDFRDFFPSLTRADVAGVLSAASHGGRLLGCIDN
jgi:retron-type reverse transcriptase